MSQINEIKQNIEVKPYNLNDCLYIQTPKGFKNPVAWYDEDKDLFCIGEYENRGKYYLDFPHDRAYKPNLLERGDLKGGYLSGNIIGAWNVDEGLLLHRAKTLLTKKVNLVLGGNIFYIESVEVEVCGIERFGQGDGGHQIAFKVKDFYDLCKVQRCFRNINLRTSNEDKSFEFSSNDHRLLSSIVIGEKPESRFIDATKY